MKISILVFLLLSLFSLRAAAPPLPIESSEVGDVVVVLEPAAIFMLEMPVTPPEISIVNHFDLMHYYHHEDKELNLSNLQLGDHRLSDIENIIETFIDSVGVSRLVIENAGLETIPFNLVGFALVSKTLNYVSFMGNNFNLLGSRSDLPFIEAASDGLPRQRVDSLVAGMITQTWGSLAPHLDKVLEVHNASSEEFAYTNKQIFIDRSIPPITILNPVKKPATTFERVKNILVRVGLFGLGVLITFVPSILPWLLTTSTNGNGSN